MNDHQNERPFFRARLKATGVEGWARRTRIVPLGLHAAIDAGVHEPNLWNFTSDDERTKCQVHRDRLAFLEAVE